MKTATLNQAQYPQGGSVWRAIAASVRKAARAAAKHREQRRAIASLNALSDRTLKDIGIHRSEISSIVREKANERKR